MTNIDHKTQLETLIKMIEEKLNIEAMYDACDDFPMAVKLQEENLEATQKLRDYIAALRSPMMNKVVQVSATKAKLFQFINRWI